MNPQVAQLWVEALRSGRYEQTRGRMRCEDKFCCMGVLCDVHAGQTGNTWHNDYYLDDACLPPPAVLQWAGLKTDRGMVDGEEFSLTGMNDSMCYSFAEIADFIERNVDSL